MASCRHAPDDFQARNDFLPRTDHWERTLAPGDWLRSMDARGANDSPIEVDTEELVDRSAYEKFVARSARP
jgi:hypothetical protein